MDPQEAVLCRFCAGLLPIRLEPHSTRPHKPNAAAFLESGDDCPICNVVRDNWSLGNADIDENLYASISTTISLREIQISDSGVSWAILRVEAMTPHDSRCYVDEFSVTSCSANSSAAGREIWKLSETTISQKISTIDSWLRDCMSNHGGCKPSTASCLPKRLVYAGSSGCAPRLVEATELPLQVEYVTLSHSWGPALPIRTLRENVDRYSREIPIETIPQTFLDALRIVQALNMPYLWIDALCIVQDDPLEWEAEGGRMKDIYSGSVFTIAASDASRSTEGCFRRHGSVSHFPLDSASPRSQQPPKLFATRASAGGVSVLVRIQVGHIRDAAHHAVLSTRGWTLQEQVLSHRVVHCMCSELHWQCMSCYHTESGATFGTLDEGSARQELRRLNAETPIPQPERVWWSWMANYSKRNFTFWTDRLPALAGIVQHYEDATGDKPVLGLWERSLPQDLLWIRLGSISDKNKAVEIPNLPSWSWLSCPAEVGFDFWQLTIRSRGARREIIQDHTSLVDWAIDWNGIPFMSGVKNTRLTLQGPTQEIMLEEAPGAQGFSPAFLRVEDDENVDPAQGPFPWRCVGQFDSGSPRPASRYKCLLLRSRMHRDTKVLKETFLILEASPGSHNIPLYKRLGIGCFTGKIPIFDWTLRSRLGIL
ncbi:heterokaryon incompatibility protein-domain-containing protein [Xylaria palmicola]|nr:heterokaryon incompatibility protein-domain-containing protein [Xylaria palmicola]